MLAQVEAQILAETKTLTLLGKALSHSRTRTAKSLAKTIQTHLKDLGFGQAAFEIRIDPLG